MNYCHGETSGNLWKTKVNYVFFFNALRLWEGELIWLLRVFLFKLLALCGDVIVGTFQRAGIRGRVLLVLWCGKEF